MKIYQFYYIINWLLKHQWIQSLWWHRFLIYDCITDVLFSADNQFLNQKQKRVSDTFDKWNFNFYLMYHLKVIQFNSTICSFLPLLCSIENASHMVQHPVIFTCQFFYQFIHTCLLIKHWTDGHFYSIYSVKYLTIDSLLAGSFYFFDWW